MVSLQVVKTRGILCEGVKETFDLAGGPRRFSGENWRPTLIALVFPLLGLRAALPTVPACAIGAGI